jgi:hydrogenase nickel incorporation protein HypA/HybF
MHELSLAQALLDLARKNAQGKRILSLKVRVGALSGVVADSLAFAFEMISRDTPAEGARLDFELEPVVMVCQKCGQRALTDEWNDLPGNEVVYRALERGCACGSQELRIAGGQDFRLVEIEVA